MAESVSPRRDFVLMIAAGLISGCAANVASTKPSQTRLVHYAVKPDPLSAVCHINPDGSVTCSGTGPKVITYTASNGYNSTTFHLLPLRTFTTTLEII